MKIKGVWFASKSRNTPPPRAVIEHIKNPPNISKSFL